MARKNYIFIEIVQYSDFGIEDAFYWIPRADTGAKSQNFT